MYQSGFFTYVNVFYPYISLDEVAVCFHRFQVYFDATAENLKHTLSIINSALYFARSYSQV